MQLDAIQFRHKCGNNQRKQDDQPRHKTEDNKTRQLMDELNNHRHKKKDRIRETPLAQN